MKQNVRISWCWQPYYMPDWKFQFFFPILYFYFFELLLYKIKKYSHWEKTTSSVEKLVKREWNGSIKVHFDVSTLRELWRCSQAFHGILWPFRLNNFHNFLQNKFIWFSSNKGKEWKKVFAETRNYENVEKTLLIWHLNPLSANPTKWSNTHKQFVGNSQQIAWVSLTILWGWCLKG